MKSKHSGVHLQFNHSNIFKIIGQVQLADYMLHYIQWVQSRDTDPSN